MTRPRELPAPTVAIAVDPASLAGELGRVLEARGLRTAGAGSWADVLPTGARAIALCRPDPPTAEQAANLAPACARAARAGQPVVVLAAHAQGKPSQTLERVAALAYLRAHGAIVCPHPDVWIETLVLCARHGLPPGPRVAIVAPPATWLALAAAALQAEQSGTGERAPLYRDAAAVGPADTVLLDPSVLSDELGERTGGRARITAALLIPVLGRATPPTQAPAAAPSPPLVGLREAIAAATLAGQLGERIAAGLGRAPPDVEALAVDHDRFARQLGRLERRAGDHEAKVLLSAYGVNVTRQAVATTPSAATRLAKRAGWPVEIKPWSADVPSEPEGCPVEVELYSAPDVRRAFAAVASAAKLASGAPVIVREAPQPGREVAVEIRPIGPLGFIVLLYPHPAAEPVAAPAPLAVTDAHALARHVEASRAGDPEPDRAALADLLLRASAMVAGSDAFATFDLPRVLVYPRGDGAVVVDARATLRR
jgi:hypothetical protein